MKLKIIVSFFLIAGCVSAPKVSTYSSMQWVPDSEVIRVPAAEFDNVQAKEFYLSSVRRAQVWTAPDIERFDMTQSDYPEVGGPYYNAGETVNCTYNDEETRKKKPGSGKTPKFWCNRDGEKKVVKIKYFSSNPDDNREVFSSAVSTRLLRALGFMANRVYSVSVNCPGCKENPWDIDDKDQKPRTTPFSPALIEFKPAGKVIHRDAIGGWSWKDIDLIDPNLPAEEQAQMRLHRGALKMLAAFIQHSDNKPPQQNIICLDEIQQADGKPFCARPLMYIHDVGATWGGGGRFSTNSAKMSFNHFISDCVWENIESRKPRIHLRSSLSGSLSDDLLDSVSEESYVFLVDLLKRFASNPERIRKLFELSQVEKLHQYKKEKITVDHWVAAFNIKLNELSTKSCFKQQRESLGKAVKNGLPFSVSILQ